MNWFDYGILGFIGLSTLIGFWRGFVREVLSLATLGVSLAIAYTTSDKVEPFLQDYIAIPSMRKIAAFAAVFFVMLLLMAIAYSILVSVISRTDLGGTDRLLGMIFGATRGIAMVVALVFLLGFTPFPKDPWWKESQLVQRFEDMAHWSCQFLPVELHNRSFCG